MTRGSRLKSWTTWGKAHQILSGKDRGRNIIVLSFFMFAIGTLVESAGRLILHAENLGTLFFVLGGMAFGVGLSAYLSANDDSGPEE